MMRSLYSTTDLCMKKQTYWARVLEEYGVLEVVNKSLESGVGGIFVDGETAVLVLSDTDVDGGALLVDTCDGEGAANVGAL